MIFFFKEGHLFTMFINPRFPHTTHLQQTTLKTSLHSLIMKRVKNIVLSAAEAQKAFACGKGLKWFPMAYT